MSKLNITFTVTVPYDFIKEIFDQAINHWIENRQSRTSGLAKAMILGVAVDQFKHGFSLLGALAITQAKGRGMQQVAMTSAKVMIPASATTYGGEMTVTASSLENGSTKININGRTQGLFGSTLKKNINGLKDYLIQTFPEIEKQYNKAERQQNPETLTRASIAQEIEALHDLYEKGVLNDNEYSQAKKRVLDNNEG